MEGSRPEGAVSGPGCSRPDHRRSSPLRGTAPGSEERRGRRDAALSELSAILVAHAVAEEKEVYPELRNRADDVTGEEVEHGSEEHAEGHAALLQVLEIGEPEAEEFGEAVEELTKALAHHLDEEERTILNPAREEVSDEVRDRLGTTFFEERQRQLDAGCGSIENVRRLVEESETVEP